MPTGYELLTDRYRNKGTAFTHAERDHYGLHGLLPPAIEDLELQLERVAFEESLKPDDLERHVFLRALQERNSVLFYAYLRREVERLLPIVYTPTVGLACQQWSKIYRREHGLYLSWPLRDRADELLDAVVGNEEIDAIVVTDGERVLGLGDLGAGGMGIPIGKLALYTSVGGIDPARTLPVVLDAGTDNEQLLSDPLYLGWRHRRVRGAEYDDLVDRFVDAVRRKFPHVLLQWEDFAQVNAHRLLARHRDRICSFNDDIQGTAVITAAAVAAGLGIAEVPVEELRVVVVGAGSAGTGIAGQLAAMLETAGLAPIDARRRCWLVDRDGLLHSKLAGLQAFQEPFVHEWNAVAGWDPDDAGHIGLEAVVRRVRPHALIGVTGQPGLFTEAVIRAMAEGVERPIVLPLSNPTPRAEAIPADVVRWTDGNALVGTGSPFAPVVYEGVEHQITQVNNVYVFPGVGLGAIAVRAQRVTDSMLTAAATAIGELASAAATSGPVRLLPPVDAAHQVARHVAVAVARCAVQEGAAILEGTGSIEDLVEGAVWEPEYDHTVPT
ncbi:MAG: NAD-dependent malic enzyme [Ilumatobacteraceae bacterium]